MKQPLWRIFLNVALLAFAAQRGAGIAMTILAHANPLLVVAFAIQFVTAVAAAIAIWRGRRMDTWLIALAGTVVLGAAIQVILAGAMAVPGAIAQAMFAVLAVTGLLFVMHNVPEE
jgi:hypothetical protein